MSVREKILWAAGVILLIILYLASSTDLIIKEREVQIHPVSIILNDVNDTYFQNFKKGVDQAAQDYYADTSYTTLYDEISQEQQLWLINREIEDGAEAVVVVPVDSADLDGALAEHRSAVPLVILGEGPMENGVCGRILVDSRGAGKLLAEEALKEQPEETVWYLIAGRLDPANTDLILEGVKGVLEEQGAEYVLTGADRNGEPIRSAMEEAALSGKKAAVIAMDKEILTEAAEILKSEPELQAGILGVYGVGSTTSLLGSLEAGVIDGLVTFDQYTAGYQSVETAVEAIRSADLKETVQMDYYYITGENLREKKYETMLYPME